MDASFLSMFPGCLASFGHWVRPVVYLGWQVPFWGVPGGSPLGRILADWGTYSHYPMSKEVLVYYCNIVWLTYTLDCRERQSMVFP